MAHASDASGDTSSLIVDIGAVLGLVLAGAVIYGFHDAAPEIHPITEKTFHFEPLEIDQTRLDSERFERFGGVDLADSKEQAEKLRTALREANAMQFGQHGRQQYRQASMKIMYAADEVITQEGVEGLLVAARPIFDDCADGLNELLAALKTGELTFEAAAQNPPEKFVKYRRNCGKVFPVMVEEFSLVDEEGNWNDPDTGPTMFEILNRYRIAQIAHMRKPSFEQMTPYEQELMVRWRIEDPEAYPLSKRIEYARNASEYLGDYPVDVILGKLYAEEEDWESALTHYEKACDENPNDFELQRRCKWLGEKVAPARGSSDDSTGEPAN